MGTWRRTAGVVLALGTGALPVAVPAAGAAADRTPPTGSLVLDGGARYTRSLQVHADLGALDPDGPEGPATGVPPYAMLTGDLAAPGGLVPLGGVDLTLAPGPDGPRRVTAAFKDLAAPEPDPGAPPVVRCLALFVCDPGNASSVTAEIVLDRTPPAVRMSRRPSGRAVLLSAVRTADAGSGVDWGTVTWRLGPRVLHGRRVALRHRAGVQRGVLEVRDRAGNATRSRFAVRVG